MQGLLVSKINEIRVVQVEESKLSFQHKKADSKKPSKKDDNPFKKGGGGSNKTVDLGAGQRQITVKFYTFDSNDANTLFNVLYKQRYCTITDKFNGKLKVYIEDVEKTDSDKHIGRTVFSIKAIVQDEIKAPTINANAKLRSVAEEMEIEVENEAFRFADEVATAQKIKDELTNTENFFDAGLDKIQGELGKILGLSSYPLNYMQGIQDRVNRVKGLNSTLERIKTSPTDFMETMKDFTKIFTIKKADKIKTIASNGKPYTATSNFSTLSQTEAKAIKSEISADSLLNTVISTGEVNQLLTKKYNTKQEFDEQLNSVLERLDTTSIDKEKIVEYKHILKAYSNNVSIKRVVDLEVKKETPLTAIVFEQYGNLDYYDDIKKINNLADNDAVSGTIKVYENASAS